MSENKNTLKIRIEQVRYNDHAWLCDCSIGNDDAGERVVTEKEVMEFVGCDSCGYVTDEHESSDGYTVSRKIPFQDFLDRCDIYGLLADIINKREGRTERAPFKSKPLPDAAMFLNPNPLANLLAKVNKNAA